MADLVQVQSAVDREEEATRLAGHRRAHRGGSAAYLDWVAAETT